MPVLGVNGSEDPPLKLYCPEGREAALSLYSVQIISYPTLMLCFPHNRVRLSWMTRSSPTFRLTVMPPMPYPILKYGNDSVPTPGMEMPYLVASGRGGFDVARRLYPTRNSLNVTGEMIDVKLMTPLISSVGAMNWFELNS